MFTLSGRHITVYHYNDTRSTVTHWSFDYDQLYVTAFRPICEAADSWSYDKVLMTVIACWIMNGLLLHDRVYRLEKHTHTPVKYMFPNFETLNWFAAQHILDTLRGIMCVLLTVVIFTLNIEQGSLNIKLGSHRPQIPPPMLPPGMLL